MASSSSSSPSRPPKRSRFSPPIHPSFSSESSSSFHDADSASSIFLKPPSNGRSKAPPSAASRLIFGDADLASPAQYDASAVLVEGEDSSDGTSCSVSEAVGEIQSEVQSRFTMPRRGPSQKARCDSTLKKSQAAEKDASSSSLQLVQDWQGEGDWAISGKLGLEFDPETVFCNFLDGTASLGISLLEKSGEDDEGAACCSPESTSVFLNDVDSDENAFLNDILEQDWMIGGALAISTTD